MAGVPRVVGAPVERLEKRDHASGHTCDDAASWTTLWKPSCPAGPVMTDEGKTACLGAVLLNYCGTVDTLACLDSLLAGERVPDRVVIADNASPDNSLEALRKELRAREPALREAALRTAAAKTAPSVVQPWMEIRPYGRNALPTDAWLTLLTNRENRGFAAGNNPGIGLLLADRRITHVWLLNNDTEVGTGSVAALHRAITRRPEIALWGGTVQYHAQPHAVQALGGGALNRRSGETRHIGAFLSAAVLPLSPSDVAKVEEEMDYVLGACMVASRRWIETVGLLNEEYFLYYEEIDWALRGRAAGLRMGYVPDLIVYHKEGASIGTDPRGGSPLSVHHLARSRFLFVARHLPDASGLKIVLSLVRQIARFVRHRRWCLLVALLSGVREGAFRGWGHRR